MVMMKVVGVQQLPFDRDREGKVLYVDMDVLECGHAIRRFKEIVGPNTYAEGERHLRDSANRDCKKCEVRHATR